MAFPVNFIFAKKNSLKYISHLDLLRLFGRALRRAEIPFAVSQGFSKHPEIVIKRALKLGVESDNEEAVIKLKEVMPREEFIGRLQKQLPEGIMIKG